jgi:acyl carrier protein
MPSSRRSRTSSWRSSSRARDPDELTETTPLISGGILDSIATLKLVMFMEEEYGVSFEPHEVDKENLDDLNSIVRLLCSKNPTVA